MKALNKDTRKQEIITLVKDFFEGNKAPLEVSVRLKMAIANGTKEPDSDLFQVYKEIVQFYKSKVKEDDPVFEKLCLLDTFIADKAGEWPWSFIKENMDINFLFSENLRNRAKIEGETLEEE